MSRHHVRDFWAVLLRVSKLNSRLNWLAGASILPDRPRALVTSMASTGNKFVITPLHGKYPIYKHRPSGSVLVNRIYPSQGCNNIYLQLPHFQMYFNLTFLLPSFSLTPSLSHSLALLFTPSLTSSLSLSLTLGMCNEQPSRREA